RRWQELAYSQLKDSRYRSISAGMGSGKSSLARVLAYHDVGKEGCKTIVAVPQNILKNSSYGPLHLRLSDGREVDWTVRYTEEDSIQDVREFVRSSVKVDPDENILVTTHSTLRDACLSEGG